MYFERVKLSLLQAVTTLASSVAQQYWPHGVLLNLKL